MAVSDIAVLAATIGTPAVAAVAILANVANSRGERRHARESARDARWFETRREVYEEALHYMHRALRQVDELHEPGMGHETGDPISPEQEMRVQVRVEILGAPDVTKAAEEFFASVRSFDFYARMRSNAGDAAAMEATHEMNKYREIAGDQIKQVEVMMRDELAKL